MLSDWTFFMKDFFHKQFNLNEMIATIVIPRRIDLFYGQCAFVVIIEQLRSCLSNLSMRKIRRITYR